MITANQLDAALKSRLASRLIPYETFMLADGTGIINVTAKTRKFSISVSYIVRQVDDRVFMSSTDMSGDYPSLQSAISALITEFRRIESRFSAYRSK
jgi:hypothetical protein